MPLITQPFDHLHNDSLIPSCTEHQDGVPRFTNVLGDNAPLSNPFGNAVWQVLNDLSTPVIPVVGKPRQT
jgi:hypothetical protein